MLRVDLRSPRVLPPSRSCTHFIYRNIRDTIICPDPPGASAAGDKYHRGTQLFDALARAMHDVDIGHWKLRSEGTISQAQASALAGRIASDQRLSSSLTRTAAMYFPTIDDADLRRQLILMGPSWAELARHDRDTLNHLVKIQTQKIQLR